MPTWAFPRLLRVVRASSPQNQGVRGLLNAITALKVESPADFVIDRASDKDLTDKKLEPANAAYTIEVKSGEPGQKDAPTTTLLIGGSVDDKNQQVFARLKDEKNIVRISAAALDPIRKAADRPAELRDRLLVRPDFARPDAINLTNDKGTFRLRDQKSAEGWMLYRGTVPAQGEATDRNVVSFFLNQLAQARVEDFVDGDIKIDKPAAVVGIWVDGLKAPEKKEPGKEDKTEPQLKEPNKPNVELTFARPEGDRVTVRRKLLDGSEEHTSIVKVPVAAFEAFNRGPLDFLRRDIPAFTTEMADIGKDVTRVTLVHEGETVEVVKETKDNQPTWKFDDPADLKGQLASKPMIDMILRRLNTGLRVSRLAAEKPSAEDLDKKYGLKFLKYRARSWSPGTASRSPSTTTLAMRPRTSRGFTLASARATSFTSWGRSTSRCSVPSCRTRASSRSRDPRSAH